MSSDSPATACPITGAELAAMRERGACELVAGRIVPMTPAGGEHGAIEVNLAAELKLFLRQQRPPPRWLAGGEVGIYTQRNPDTVRGANIAFFSRQRLPTGLPAGYVDVAPELIVEIMSPSERWSDLETKIAEYFAIDVERVWVVLPQARAVCVSRAPTTWQRLGEDALLQGEGVLASFALPVAHLLAP